MDYVPEESAVNTETIEVRALLTGRQPGYSSSGDIGLSFTQLQI